MDARHVPDRSELIAIWQRSGDAIVDLAQATSDLEWHAPTPCPGWTVADVVAHVIDVEQVLAQDPRPDHEPNWSMHAHATGDVGRFTEIGVDWRRGRSREAVIDELVDTLNRRRAQIDALPVDATVLSPFGRPTSVERLMRVRILDTWVHEQDIRAALGRPGGMDTAPAIVTLQQFIENLPVAWARRAQAPQGAVAHLVVADVGRGVEAWAMAEADAMGEMCSPVTEPTVTVTLMWSDYLALCAGRQPLVEVRERVAIDGDHELADRLLSVLTVTP